MKAVANIKLSHETGGRQVWLEVVVDYWERQFVSEEAAIVLVGDGPDWRIPIDPAEIPERFSHRLTAAAEKHLADLADEERAERILADSGERNRWE